MSFVIEVISEIMRIFFALLGIAIVLAMAVFAIWLTFWILFIILKVLMLIAPFIIAVMVVAFLAQVIFGRR